MASDHLINLRVTCPSCGQRHRLQIHREPAATVTTLIRCVRTHCRTKIEIWWDFTDGSGWLVTGGDAQQRGRGIECLGS